MTSPHRQLMECAIASRHGSDETQSANLVILSTNGIDTSFDKELRLNLPPPQLADRVLARYGKATDDALILVGHWGGFDDGA